MSKAEMAIYGRPNFVIVNGKYQRETRPEEVRVMARAEGYALVRKKGCMPFAVREKELQSAGQQEEVRKE